MARWIRNGRQYSNACYFHFWVRSKISSRPLLVIGFEIEVGETRFGFTDHINLARHVYISHPPLPHPDPPPAPSCVRRRAGGDGSQAASMVICGGNLDGQPEAPSATATTATRRWRGFSGGLICTPFSWLGGGMWSKRTWGDSAGWLLCHQFFFTC